MFEREGEKGKVPYAKIEGGEPAWSGHGFRAREPIQRKEKNQRRGFENKELSEKGPTQSNGSLKQQKQGVGKDSEENRRNFFHRDWAYMGSLVAYCTPGTLKDSEESDDLIWAPAGDRKDQKEG